MKKYNYISAGFFILVGAYVLYETSGYSIHAGGQGNPAIWPQCLGVMLLVFSVILIIQTALNVPSVTEDADGNEQKGIDWLSTGMKKVYLAMAMIGGFVVLMNIFGMLIALLVLIPGIMWLMGCHSKVMYVALPVAMVAFVYIFFVQIMTITLPGGLFF